MLQEKVLESAKEFSESSKPFALDEGNVFLKDIQTKNEKKISEFISKEKLQEKFNKEELDGVRSTLLYSTIKVVNFITDLIYFDLGDTADTVIA
jgi:hypothetical protein